MENYSRLQLKLHELQSPHLKAECNKSDRLHKKKKTTPKPKPKQKTSWGKTVCKICFLYNFLYLVYSDKILVTMDVLEMVFRANPITQLSAQTRFKNKQRNFTTKQLLSLILLSLDVCTVLRRLCITSDSLCLAESL